MTTEVIERWLLDWFAARGPLPGTSEAERSSADFLATGAVDSLGVVELVGAVERRFGIRFRQEHFDRPGFASIRGLSALVSELVQEAVVAGKAS